MRTKKIQLLVSHQDYESIMGFLKQTDHTIRFNNKDAAEMTTELRKAKLVTEHHLPDDVVRLNSKVLIKADEGKLMEITLVPPAKANMAKKFVSILSPIGRALIGFRKGCTVKWVVPSGKKTFTILAVSKG